MDLIGNIVSIINAFGYEEIFSYDLLGRVTGKKDREEVIMQPIPTQKPEISKVLYIMTGKVWSTPTTA